MAQFVHCCGYFRTRLVELLLGRDLGVDQVDPAFGLYLCEGIGLPAARAASASPRSRSMAGRQSSGSERF
jgi:hypothetical protein